MALARATHHAVQRHQCTQTVTLPPAATYAATLAPSPVVPAPAVTCAAPAPVIEFVALAPVMEYIAPAPAVTYAAPSQQLPPAYTMTTVTTGVNLDITGLVKPQFSISAVEASAPQVVASLGRVCCAREQPSPSGTHRCNSTAASYCSGNSSASGCGADSGTNGGDHRSVSTGGDGGSRLGTFLFLKNSSLPK